MNNFVVHRLIAYMCRRGDAINRCLQAAIIRGGLRINAAILRITEGWMCQKTENGYKENTYEIFTYIYSF